jgi:hypothetical protein
VFGDLDLDGHYADVWTRRNPRSREAVPGSATAQGLTRPTSPFSYSISPGVWLSCGGMAAYWGTGHSDR